MDATNPCVYITSVFDAMIEFVGPADKCVFVGLSGVLRGGILGSDSGKDFVYVAGTVEAPINFKEYGDMFVDGGTLQEVVNLAQMGSWFDACRASLMRPIIGKDTPNHNCFSVALLLPPILSKLRLLHPGIEIEIVTSSRPSDLRRREADIAVRNFRPTEPDLLAKRVRDNPARLYAPPGYV